MTQMVDNVNVSRDGVVRRDGEVIGRVVRQDGVSFASALLGAKPPVVWAPQDVNGKALLGALDRRKDAVAVVVKTSEPDSVGDIHTGQDWAGMGEYVACSLTWRGSYFGVSRYPHESKWVVDYFAPLGSLMPHFANGEGTRVTRAWVLKPEQAAIVDAAVAEWRDEQLDQEG